MKKSARRDDGPRDLDPDLDARLVAMIAGEASEFEVESLERLMEARPEVRLRKRELESIHGLVDSAVKRDDAEWKLSPERREHVMRTLGIGKGGNGGDGKESRIRRAGRKVLWAAAACLMINVILFGWIVGQMSLRNAASKSSEARMAHGDDAVLLDSAASMVGEGDETFRGAVPEAMVPPSAPSPKPDAGGAAVTGIEARAKEKKVAKVPPAKPGRRAPGGKGGENALATLRESLGPGLEPSEEESVSGDDSPSADPFGGEVDARFEERRAAPQRIANGRTRTPTAAAVVDGIKRSESRKFVYPTEADGPEDASVSKRPAFGDEEGGIGWGSGGLGGTGSGKKESAPVPRGTTASPGASPGILPPLTAGRSVIVDEESAEPSREEAPSNRSTFGRPAKGKKGGLTTGLASDLDRVGNALKQAEGFKDLGLYDEAANEYEGTLRLDPQNQTARQGLESLEKLKVEHRRRAYDETRSDMLKQVDQAWEHAVIPPVEGEGQGRASGQNAQGRGESDDIVTRTWKVGPKFLEELAAAESEDEDEADPFGEADGDLGGGALKPRRATVDLFKEIGIEFPPGSSVAYIPSSGQLVVSNTPENLELVDMVSKQLSEEKVRLEDEKRVLEESLEVDAGKEAFSTFSLHVSDVSFKLAKASLAKGEWPATGQVRVEEFVNAFDYGDPAPTQEEKVACRVEQAAHPFMQQRNLVRISMQTAAVGRSGGTPLSLTVLLDHSGSMERMDRAESVQRAFDLLASQLTAQDVVTLISFARTPRLLADRIPGSEAGSLARSVAVTPSGGGTNLEAALQLGVEKAREQKIEGGQNRIILLTDGAANLGNARADDLAQMVEGMRQEGIAFDACGVGAEGLNDEILESLTRKGDGRYYFLDRPEDADAGFAKQIAGALRPAARNVKVQVEFNPRRVGRYKLYGFDKHRLKTEDFRNDSVDAAEMAAAEAGNAVYQVEVRPDGGGAIGSVSVRFQDMATGRMVEKRWVIPYEEAVARLEEAPPAMRLAGCAAFLGEKLDGSVIGERVRMSELGRIASSLRGAFPASARVGELIEMTQRVREMGGE